MGRPHPQRARERAGASPGRGRGTGAQRWARAAGRSPHTAPLPDPCPPPRSRLPAAGVLAAPRPKCPPPLSPRPSTMSPWRRRGGVAGCPDGPVLGRGRGRRAVLTWTWAAGAGGGAGGRACFRPGPVGAAGAEIRRAPPPRGSAVVRRLGGLPARLGGVGGWGSSWPLPNACLGSVFLLRLRGLCFVFAAGLGLLGGGRLCCPLGFLGCRRGAGRGPCYPRYQDCA